MMRQTFRGVLVAILLGCVAQPHAADIAYEIWHANSTNFDAAVPVACWVQGNSHLDTNAAPPPSTNFYWIRGLEMQSEIELSHIVGGPEGVTDFAVQLTTPKVVKHQTRSPLRISMDIDNHQYEYGYVVPRQAFFTLYERDEFGQFWTVETAIDEGTWTNESWTGGIPPRRENHRFDRTLWHDISEWESLYPLDSVVELFLELTLDYRWSRYWPDDRTATLATYPLCNIEMVDTLPPAPPLFVSRCDAGVRLAWTAVDQSTDFSAQPAVVGSTWEMAVSIDPPGSGTADGAGYYADQTAALLSATPQPGFRLSHWTEGGAVTSTQATFSILMATNRSLTAVFAQTWELQTVASPAGGGNVFGAGVYDDGVDAAIVATPNPGGWVFSGWVGEGISDPNAQTTTVVMTQDRTATARFTGRCELTVSALPPSGGVVSGGGTYDTGTNASISATPASGYQFCWWQGQGVADRYSSATTVDMSKDRSVVGQFKRTDPPTNGVGIVEYYFDSDPGFGTGIQVHDAFIADVSSLSLGAHTLYVRGLDADTGEWGHSFALPFVKELPSTDVQRIETFYDSDPGEGHGSDLVVGLGEELVGSQVLDCTSLTSGSHTLYARGQNESGIWGPVFSLPFVKEIALGNELIDALEFFTDHDPGSGQGASLPLTPASNATERLLMGVDNLSMGVHRLFARGRNNAGVWGQALPLVFSHEPQCLVGQGESVAAIRYLVSSDGSQIGESTVLTDLTPASPVVVSFDPNISGLPPATNYQLHVQGISQEGLPGLERNFVFEMVGTNQDFSAYNIWKTNVFSAAEQTNHTVSGYMFDPDGDGSVNLVEFAFGTDPKNVDSWYVPVGESVDGYLQLTYRQRRGGTGTVGVHFTVDGLRYTVEVTDKLIPSHWKTGGTLLEQVGTAEDNGNGTETVTVRYTTLMSALPRKFMRLRLIVL
jgi:hypothetical protein